MQLATPVSATPWARPIGLGDRPCLMGSCFSEHIGERLNGQGWEALVNPFGTIFNAPALHRLVRWSLGAEELPRSEVVQRGGLYWHHALHSQVYADSEEALWEKMEALRIETRTFLGNCTHLAITLGTAWVYARREDGVVVANCHKVPSQHFEKRLLTVEEVEDALWGMAALLPQAALLLTVSPVRHLKDTLPLNAVSKAVLRLASHRLELRGDAHYFPAFEIMNDELRDYRFYADDLLHPSGLAVGAIWERFGQTCLTAEAQAFALEWARLRQGLLHRPLAPGHEYRAHLDRMAKELERLSAVYPKAHLPEARRALDALRQQYG